MTSEGSKSPTTYLAQMIRMQEEIGTGGGGFRFIYGAFLEEAAEVLKKQYPARNVLKRLLPLAIFGVILPWR